ncbi:hypothetical protein NUACC21_47620 [Scytonema sp. NUACC21]
MAIKYVLEGQTRIEVSELLSCSYKTLSTWIDQFLEGGLDKLVSPIIHKVPSQLNLEQKLELKIILEKKPIDSGINRNIWTAKIISSMMETLWGVKLKTSRIYEILDELNLSHQKANIQDEIQI